MAIGIVGCASSGTTIGVGENGRDGRLELSGVQFEMSSSRPVRVRLRDEAKMGLLHDDRDEVDRYVRVILEQAIFALKSSHPELIVVERRSIEELLRELKFQAEGLVKDADLAKIGHFLGLDYVVVFDPVYSDLNELYGLKNRIDVWEVMIPVKIIAVSSAEVKLNCLASVRAKVGRELTAADVRALNREALGMAAKLAGQCLSTSVGESAPVF
jgi:hypothetical protein